MGMLTTQKFPVFSLDPATANRKFQRNENQWSKAETIKGKSGINKSLFSLRCSFPLNPQGKFVVGFPPKIFPLVSCNKKETRGMGLRPKERGVVARASNPGKRKEHPPSRNLGNGMVKRKLHDAKHESYSEADEYHYSTQPTIDNKPDLDSAVVTTQPGDYYQLNGKPKQEGQMLGADSGVNVDLEVGDGEYILRIKRRKILCSTEEEMVNEAKKMTQNAAILLVQAKMLRDLGEHLLEQYQLSLQYIFGKSASTNDNLD